MYFSESESEMSFQGKRRKDIESYIQSTLSIIQSFKNSSMNSKEKSSPSIAHSLLEDMNKPLGLQDILQRYYEVKDQLEQQYQYLSSTGNQSKNIVSYLSWPEHFHRKKPSSSSHYSDSITPWEGSQYMINLLSSLAHKLLLKYSFQALHNHRNILKISKAAADQKYHLKAMKLVEHIFNLWKSYWFEVIQRRYASAKGHQHHQTELLLKAIRKWNQKTTQRIQSKQLDLLIVERYRRNLSRDAMAIWRILLSRCQQRKKLVSRSLKRHHPKWTWHSPNTMTRYYSMIENCFNLFRLNRAMMSWTRLLLKKRKKQNLQRKSERLTFRLQKRILVNTICKWLKSMAVAKKSKSQGTEPMTSPGPHPSHQEVLQQSSEKEPFVQKLDKSTSIPRLLQANNPSDASEPAKSFKSAVTPISARQQIEIDTSRAQLGNKMPAVSPSLPARNSHAISLDHKQAHSPDTILPVSLSESELSTQSISKLTDDSQQYRLKIEKFDFQSLPELSEQFMPQFIANEGTLPLSYALYRMDQQGLSAKGSKEMAKSQHEQTKFRDGLKASQCSEPIVGSNLLSAESSEEDRHIPRSLQVHLIGSRHRLRKNISAEEEIMLRTRPASHSSRFDEVEKRFKKSSWIRVGEMFHEWRQRSRGRKVLKNVFKFSFRRWQNRYERSRSPFVLLLTLFIAWKEQVLIHKERVYQHQLNQKALVFRGMSLLTKGFTGWVYGVRVVKREKHAQKLKNLMSLAQCWLEWMMLIKKSRQKYQKAVVCHQHELFKFSLTRWKAYIEYCQFELQTISNVIGYIRVKRYLQHWTLALRYLRVQRLHGRHLMMKEAEMRSQVFVDWYRCYEVRRAVRNGAMMVEKLFRRYRMRRMFTNWPGRELSLAATAMGHQVKRRREHVNRESTTSQKIIKGVELKEDEFITVPVGETPPQGDGEGADVKMFGGEVSATFPTTGKTVTGMIVNSHSSYPHFQWIHLPSTHPPSSRSASRAASKSNLHPAPFFIRGNTTIPREPPHPVGYQQRAVLLGYSDGLVPTRKIITNFLKLILRLWKETAHRRGEISRRGLFLRACCRLRILSKIFYVWSSKTSIISYRNRIWIGKGTPSCSLYSPMLLSSSPIEEEVIGEEECCKPSMGISHHGMK